MEEMLLELQREKIIYLKDHITLLVGRVENTKDKINGQLNLALYNGLPVEIYKKYRAYYLSNLYKGLDEICNRLQRDDKSYLTDLEIELTNTINKQ